MNPSSYVLFEQNGLVFETHVPDQQWSYAEEWGGRRVGETAPDVEEIVLSLCFVLPPLVSEPGSYNVLTLSRCSVDADSSASHDVFLELAYDAAQSALELRTGAETALCLAGLPSGIVAGRVLRLLAIVKKDVLHAGVDAEDGGDELHVSGELPGPGWRAGVWGSPAAGLWRVTSGSVPAKAVPALAFPPGFGLSDVQVLIHGGPGAGDRHLLYSGALDHLTPWYSGDDSAWYSGDDWASREEDAIGEELIGIASDVRRLADELETWAGRSHAMADRTEALAELDCQLTRSFLRSSDEAAAWEN